MSENMYDAWDNGDRHEIRQRFSRLEELTRMARESGLWDKVGFPKELERFAALVAAAERREWVGLTEEEVDECYYWKGRQWTTDELVRHVEAKLKEKNA